ncbi:MAG TPA: isoprenylcysteine carboxylmethyltransferase family protein [Caulobacteraceae bacterium]|nr:isoprenylcysteine carboxylmethyltransferase family protein [Caulobacteraceae bacterium]
MIDMLGFLFAVYGVVCYAIFFVTFLYAIAFVEGIGVPKTIDSGAAGPIVPALVVDAALLALFAVQHSLMARPFFKRGWTRIVPPPIERSTFVLFASLALIGLFIWWRPLPQTIWSLLPTWSAGAVTALSLAGFGLVLASTFLISHFELFGLKQVYDRLRGRRPSAPEFRTPGPYKLVRHPLYLGFIVAFWATPRMSLGHLVFAIATTAYILIAIQLEEHDLTTVFGERYRTYRRQVGMLTPRITGAKSAGSSLPRVLNEAERRSLGVNNR